MSTKRLFFALWPDDKRAVILPGIEIRMRGAGSEIQEVGGDFLQHRPLGTADQRGVTEPAALHGAVEEFQGARGGE